MLQMTNFRNHHNVSTFSAKSPKLLYVFQKICVLTLYLGLTFCLNNFCFHKLIFLFLGM